MTRPQKTAVLASMLVVLLLAPLSARSQGMKGMGKGSMSTGMSMTAPKDAPVIPPVTGYSEGKTILFIHTETSDEKLAKILTDMMGGSPVLVVPSLAKIPQDLLAHVYVFTNGLNCKESRIYRSLCGLPHPNAFVPQTYLISGTL